MKRKKQLENSISHLTCLLNKLSSRIDDNDEYNVAYNRLIIQRAELRHRLSEISSSNVINLFNFDFRFKKKEKLICDYF